MDYPVKLKKKSYFNVWSYCSLQIWALQIRIQDISKTNTAMSFKLGQPIEDDQ